MQMGIFVLFNVCVDRYLVGVPPASSHVHVALDLFFILIFVINVKKMQVK